MLKNILLLITAAIMAVSCITNADNAPAKEHIVNGSTAPAFNTTGMDNATFQSPADFEGKTTLLALFTTWCPYCQKELPHINIAWQHFKDNPGINVIGIARGGEYAQTPEVLQKYWTDNNLSFPWFLDQDRSIYNLFASSDIPRLYIIDKTGTVVWHAVSPQYQSAQYIQLLEQYSAE